MFFTGTKNFKKWRDKPIFPACFLTKPPHIFMEEKTFFYRLLLFLGVSSSQPAPKHLSTPYF
jgi:hypothetical protein